MERLAYSMLLPAFVLSFAAGLSGCQDPCDATQNVEASVAEAELGYSEADVHALVAGVHESETQAPGETLATSLTLDVETIDWMQPIDESCGNTTWGYARATFELALGDLEFRGPINGSIDAEDRQSYSTITTWAQIESGEIGESLHIGDGDVQLRLVFEGGDTHVLIYEPVGTSEWVLTYGDEPVAG
jgi:hypothetical protein